MSTTFSSGTSNIPLPYLYSRKTTEKGLMYYENHAAETTSWCHPAKLAELQVSGFVAPCTSSLPFVEGNFDDADYPVPAPWNRRTKKENGRVYYVNAETKETSWLHPEALERGHSPSSRELAPFRAIKEAGTVDGVTLEPEENWTSKGVLPPWVVEEVCAGGRDAGRPYWVDYRDGTKNLSQSPVHIYKAGLQLAVQEEQLLKEQRSAMD